MCPALKGAKALKLEAHLTTTAFGAGTLAALTVAASATGVLAATGVRTASGSRTATAGSVTTSLRSGWRVEVNVGLALLDSLDYGCLSTAACHEVELGVITQGLELLTRLPLHLYVGDVLESVEEEKPDVLIVDSIQTLYQDSLESPAGSVAQVRACTLELMQLAKGEGITVFVIGHVNKEGSIAGPKVLEHMVDCVLYFEGEAHMSYRILRAAKNRFGATNEIGVFEMRSEGLVEVPNPSEMLLSGRPDDAPGTCVTCVMEGQRPVLAEVQALLAPAAQSVSRRTSNGFDYNRAAMLMAVLEKRGALKVSGCDAFLNVIGGLSVDEPAADLAAVLALASSYLDKPIGNHVAAIGEVGLTGELRSVNHLSERLSEVHRLGFETCIIPKQRKDQIRAPQGLALIEACNIAEALRAIVQA